MSLLYLWQCLLGGKRKIISKEHISFLMKTQRRDCSNAHWETGSQGEMEILDSTITEVTQGSTGHTVKARQWHSPAPYSAGTGRPHPELSSAPPALKPSRSFLFVTSAQTPSAIGSALACMRSTAWEPWQAVASTATETMTASLQGGWNLLWQPQWSHQQTGENDNVLTPLSYSSLCAVCVLVPFFFFGCVTRWGNCEKNGSIIKNTDGCWRWCCDSKAQTVQSNTTS